jgi:hypothetical protein
MKKLIGLVVALSFPAFAEDPLNCMAIHAIAHTIMDARQGGVSKDTMSKIVDQNSAGNNGFRMVANALMNEAYKQEIKSSAHKQTDATVKFAGESMRLCFKMGGK